MAAAVAVIGVLIMVVVADARVWSGIDVFNLEVGV
jgi:hypothetical protein